MQDRLPYPHCFRTFSKPLRFMTLSHGMKQILRKSYPSRQVHQLLGKTSKNLCCGVEGCPNVWVFKFHWVLMTEQSALWLLSFAPQHAVLPVCWHPQELTAGGATGPRAAGVHHWGGSGQADHPYVAEKVLEAHQSREWTPKQWAFWFLSKGEGSREKILPILPSENLTSLHRHYPLWLSHTSNLNPGKNSAGSPVQGPPEISTSSSSNAGVLKL